MVKDNSEIRQLELEEARIKYEAKNRANNYVFWTIIPLIVSLLITQKDFFAKIISVTIKAELNLLDLIQLSELKPVLLIMHVLVILIVILAFPFFATLLIKLWKHQESSALSLYLKVIKQLKKRAK